MLLEVSREFRRDSPCPEREDCLATVFRGSDEVLGGSAVFRGGGGISGTTTNSHATTSPPLVVCVVAPFDSNRIFDNKLNKNYRWVFEKQAF